MKLIKLIISLPITIILNGCAAMVSSDQHNGHHRHNSVSVGVHGSGSGGLGALIVGGIIGAVINQAAHESKEMELEKKKLAEKQTRDKLEKENFLKAQTSQENIDRQRLTGSEQVTKWYQLGKDQKCYEMQTVSGITDVFASVDLKYCNP